MKINFIFKIIVIALVALGVSVGLWFYLNGYLTKSKASNGVAVFDFTQKNIEAKGGEIVHGDLTITAASGMSGIDIAFNTEGTNLSFSYKDTVSHIPAGYEMILDESHTTVQDTTAGIKKLKRIVLISKQPAVLLPKSALIPLYFSVINTGELSSKSKITVSFSSSQVVGVSDTNISGTVFSLEKGTSPLPLDTNINIINNEPLSFTVEIRDPRAASVMNLACDMVRNTSKANCGRGIAVMWKDSPNEDGYKIYKNNQLVKTVGSNTTSYNDPWCANFNPNTYSVIAYNAKGSVSTTLPTVVCGCQICPTAAAPTPGIVQPTNSADLIFRVIFPNAAPTVGEIPNVKITIFDNDGKRVCDGDTDCASVVTFRREPNAQVPNTFRSPQLQYSSLTKNQAYSVVVKQNHTVKQTYKNVYLMRLKVLQCLEGTNDSGCGDLMEGVKTNPLFSGDLDGSNTIDQIDSDKLSAGIGVNSAEGDLNFDGLTDQADVDILGKNFGKKGN